MHFPTIEGVIRRRVLVNYRVDPEVARALVPASLELDLHGGWAHAGICLIRLEQIRPACSPIDIGISSENIAHRFAVRSGNHGSVRHDSIRTGVFVPRRDTDNLLNRIAGGRLFPGRHGAAEFAVTDTLAEDGADDSHRGLLALEITGEDGLAITVRGRPTRAWPAGSAFRDLAEASAFYAQGVRGWSPTPDGSLEALDLCIPGWSCSAFALEALHSSYFADPTRFPPGSVELDHALFMHDLPHRWEAVN